MSARGVRRTLVLLLAIDALLLGGNLLFLLHDEPAREPVHPVFSDPAWNGDNDRSYIEVAGAVQLIAAIVVLAAVWVRRREPVYLAWAAAFTWVVADDILTLHERGGSALARAWGLPAPFGYSPQYLGEALVWAIVAPVLAAFLIAAHRRADALGRKDSRALVAASAVLAVFAVGVDLLATLAHGAPPPLRTLVVLTETAGELLAMTLILACVLAPTARASAMSPSRPAS